MDPNPSPQPPAAVEDLAAWFRPFREGIVGLHQTLETPFGTKEMLYADWTASGRLHAPIEAALLERFGPLVANTHSESNGSGEAMTLAYHEAHAILKRHVNAGPGDVILTQGSGMTGVVNKLQRILGLRVPERLQPYCAVPLEARPVVFITHLEHHSNQTSWLETVCEVEVVEPDDLGLVDPDRLEERLRHHAGRTLIGAFSACSNVTGLVTPHHELARRMHRHGGVCFVDFAASAPYVPIDMHPDGDGEARLDGIFFSPHKFLGGPGTPGVLVFDSALYHNRVPDQPGGGTVLWTNPWQGHSFIRDIEVREDGGTPAFLQTFKAALAARLKEAMDPARMRAREDELLEILLPGLARVPGLHLLAAQHTRRLGILSFYFEHLHYNLAVRLLNDRFGIQVRGGCSCAGTYGHYLLHVDPTRSHAITDKIDHGDLSDKPGWVRLSIHPTTTDGEARTLVAAMDELSRCGQAWAADYVYSPLTNEYHHRDGQPLKAATVRGWFDLG